MKRDALYAVPQKGREAEPMCPATAVKRARASNDKKDRRIRVLKQGGSANGGSCFNHIGWENVFNYSISFYRLKIWVLGGCCNFTGRHADGSLPVEDFNLELENQSGEKVKLGTKDDQRLIFTLDGLMVFIQWIL
ncbi:hypothetical protein HanPI659440_Chr17g0666061 [Helianthus annuus]|nr:hypothetical protein HanPI659440_Chr17g0666061 [Helianthus annuus]